MARHFSKILESEEKATTNHIYEAKTVPPKVGLPRVL